jgi:hypothetical protein
MLVCECYKSDSALLSYDSSQGCQPKTLEFQVVRNCNSSDHKARVS